MCNKDRIDIYRPFVRCNTWKIAMLPTLIIKKSKNKNNFYCFPIVRAWYYSLCSFLHLDYFEVKKIVLQYTRQSITLFYKK